jgi:predicted patatin/cPLA2 family phospholipase
MDLNCFFEALEELANRLYNHQDAYENLQEVIEVIKKHVSPNSISNQKH